MRLLKEHAGFVLIFVLCAILRFIPLFDYQFTFDELSGLDRTQFNSTAEVIEKGVKIDAHPALVQLIIYWLSQLFGYVTWIIKLPFILFSLGAVLYAYLFGLKFVSKQSGLFASGILAFSLVFVFYAPIARMYISGIFFSLALLYHFYKIFFSGSSRTQDYVALGIFALLSALNQHVNSLFALTVCASGCFFLDKFNWKPYLFTCLITVLLYLPHLPVTLYQFSVPGIGRDAGGWLDKPELSVVLDFIAVLFGTGYTVYAFILVFLIAVLLKRVRVPRSLYLLPVLFLINFLVVYFYSVFRSPVYQHSVMLFAGTALVLFVSAYLRFENKAMFYLCFVITMGLLLGQTYVVKDYFAQSVKTVYEYQFERTAAYEKKFGQENVAAVFFDCDTLMRKIYYEKYKSGYELKIGSDSLVAYGERKLYGDKGRSSLSMFSLYIKNLPGDYLALSSATPLYEKIVRAHYPYLVENTQTQAVYYKLFSKVKPSQVTAEDRLADLPAEFDTGVKFPIAVDSANEFPLGVKCKAADLVIKPGAIVLSETWLTDADTRATELEAVFSLTDPDGNALSYGARQVSDFSEASDSIVYLFSEHFLGTAFEKNKKHSLLNAYLWNKGHARFKLVKQQYYLVDYWHQKWNFWK